ncbi:MAG: 6-phosphogluconolactonase [Deltaproteobacteria bacterium]|jgi:6-phosphogluconolactonase|nr:6-phosphogluconolactonase [Deltaproteobacteria bacterium]
MASKNRKIQIAADAEAMCRAAAESLMHHIGKTLQTQDLYSIALSGGSTPRKLYALLADDTELDRQIPWERIHFFWGDERHVAPDHPDSNYRMAFEAMLSRAPIPETNIHRIHAENPDADTAAEQYAREIRRFFKIAGDEVPHFNCVLLGMGSDGHTASLFPDSPALSEKERLVVANRVEKSDSFRITLTLPVLNSADLVLFLVSGAEKADALKTVLEGAAAPARYPARLIQPSRGELIWFLDRSAARGLRHFTQEP